MRETKCNSKGKNKRITAWPTLELAVKLVGRSQQEQGSRPGSKSSEGGEEMHISNQ